MNDLISRKAAIDTILGQPPEPHYPSWYAEQIRKSHSPKSSTARTAGTEMIMDAANTGKLWQ